MRLKTQTLSCLLGGLVMANATLVQAEQRIIARIDATDLSIPAGNITDQTGEAIIIDNPNGPDQVTISVNTLQPQTRYNIFLANSPTDGALPAVYIGSFKTASIALGVFNATLEVTNAFVPANQSMENAQGLADVLGAAVIPWGANTIPLNFIRIYEDENGNTGNLNLPRSPEGDNRGTLVFASVAPFSPPSDLIAYVDVPPTVRKGGNILPVSGGSFGDIVEHKVELLKDGVVLDSRVQATPFFVSIFGASAAFNTGSFNVGDQLILRLTVTDADGNQSVDNRPITVL